MCTAVSFLTNNHYFGRNLDLEYSYTEAVTITPRNFPFTFRRKAVLDKHFAIIGMAFTTDGYPLYYDATNEKGLSIAGLYFPGSAVYKPEAAGKDNIAPFEFIPWILGQCSTVPEAEYLLEHMNILDENFSPELPLTPMHWLISDKDASITVEPLEKGVKVYPNPVHLLTNNPPFDVQLQNLKNYSFDMEHLCLPGDWSSTSRFVRANYVRQHSVCNLSEEQSVSQFFHILGSVEFPRGCTKRKHNLCEKTIYSSCCNTDEGIFYYKTYDNSQIHAVSLHRENLDGKTLVSYLLREEPEVYWQN